MFGLDAELIYWSAKRNMTGKHTLDTATITKIEEKTFLAPFYRLRKKQT